MILRAALLVLAAPPAFADAILECTVIDPDPEATAACMALKSTEAEAALSGAMGIAIARLAFQFEKTGDDSALTALELADAAWEAWRDAECALVAAADLRASGPGLPEANCRITLARERIDRLDDARR